MSPRPTYAPPALPPLTIGAPLGASHHCGKRTRATRLSLSSIAVREPSDSAAAAAELLSVLQVRGKGDRIDILFPETEYQELALTRSVEHVLTVEDVIVHKLIA